MLEETPLQPGVRALKQWWRTRVWRHRCLGVEARGYTIPQVKEHFDFSTVLRPRPLKRHGLFLWREGEASGVFQESEEHAFRTSEMQQGLCRALMTDIGDTQDFCLLMYRWDAAPHACCFNARDSLAAAGFHRVQLVGSLRLVP